MAVETPVAATSSRSRTSPVASYYLLASATALLLLVGLAAMLSSSSIDSINADGDPYTLFKQQLAFLAIGVVALLITSRVGPATLKRAAPWILAASIVLLFLVVTTSLGEASGGNRNWISLGWVTAQPSEAAKLALALYLGVALAHGLPRLGTVKGAIVPAGLVAALVVGLVLAGKDIGTAAVMIVLIAAAYWTAGLPLRFFAVGAGLAIVVVGLLVSSRGTLKIRIDHWLSPAGCTPDSCRQTIHGTWALASGGIWGLGPGLSREKWSYLPKAHNDFIFAILGEEFGLVGTIFVLVALAMIAIAVNRIVHHHKDPFVQITAAAIGAWIVGQACLNIGVVLGLAPVTGVPLPLVSSGGSSMIMTLVGLGVLLAFARREPGASEALAVRPSVVRRSLAIVSGRRRG
jgi:cell division protein FtsW